MLIVILIVVAAVFALLDLLGAAPGRNLTAVAVLLLCCAVAAGRLL